MAEKLDIYTIREQIVRHLEPLRRKVQLTEEEAEATAIGNWIDRASDLTSFNSPSGEAIFYRRFRSDGGLETLKAAGEGDRFAHAALLAIARLAIVLGRPIPHPLAMYVAAYLLGDNPKMKRGRAPLSIRDDVIYEAILIAIGCGLPAERSQTARNSDGAEHSACSLVRDILASNFKRSMSEDAVIKIWQKRKPKKK